ncbi:hypothetical protein C8F04DRAFT_1200306 [Mycena alexandri]|uniref:Uncharacterized protein n=1 Tax=Mycena alexandri TaxID=1745969 RepID=A0AAD6S293_9AGAR|nr:hypothetical protein C8F04DRAFT_1200306 [Mycena alexandri]
MSVVEVDYMRQPNMFKQRARRHTSDKETPSTPQASSSTKHTRTLCTIQPQSLASYYEPWLHELQWLLNIEHPVMYTLMTSLVSKTQQDFLREGLWHVCAMIQCVTQGKERWRILIWDPNFEILGLSKQRERGGGYNVWINRQLQERNEDGCCVPLTLAFL